MLSTEDGGSNHGLCVQKNSLPYEPFLIFIGDLPQRNGIQTNKLQA